MPWNSHEYRNCRGEGPDCDGPSHAPWCRCGPAGVPGRPDPEKTLCDGQQSDGRDDRVASPSPTAPCISRSLRLIAGLMSRLDFDLYLTTDSHQTRDRSLVSVVEEALKAGV